MNQTEERIKKLIRNNPMMSDKEVARKIGRDNEDGLNRVRTVRKVVNEANRQ